MKSINYVAAFTILTILLGRCSPSPTPPAPGCGCNSQSYLTSAVLFTQTSAEYRALCYQAYALAKVHLAEAMASAGDSLAVVLDLDETVLDNSPYTAWQIVNDQPFTPETWDLWVQKAEARAVYGAVDFLNFADSLGVALFYVSNRDTSHLEPTMANMQALGLPQLMPDHFMLKTSTSDKTDRRKAIISSGYRIVMRVGDNLGDFDGKYDKPASNEHRNAAANDDRALFGSQCIVLPNVMYGTWEGAMYGYDRSLDQEALCKLRTSHLRSVDL